MDKSKRSKILTAVLVTLVVATVWFLVTGNSSHDEKATASNYYHGIFRNKKDPNIWGYEDGRLAPAPKDAIPYNPDDPNKDASSANSPMNSTRTFNGK
jgi:hypothetical protein